MGRPGPVKSYQQGSSQTADVLVKSTSAAALHCYQMMSEEGHACNCYMLQAYVCLLWDWPPFAVTAKMLLQGSHDV